MEFKNILRVVLIFLVIILFYASVFEVNEKEQVIITQFGEPVGEAITTPGLHYKLPFFQKANFFDKQFLEWNGDPNEVTTKEKIYIYIDAYARWRIVDPLLFFQKLQNIRRAQSRLDDILDGETRIAIANHNLAEIVRSTNRSFAYNEDSDDNTSADSNDSIAQNVRIEKGRSIILKNIIRIANEKTAELGIEILDLRIKRLKYSDKVLKTVYNRMISERTKISDRFLSEGEGSAKIILGDKERELKRITSEAFKTAEEIRGKADAEATTIYASAYNKNAETRELYRFLKSLETYKKTLNKKDILILSTKSDLFRYLEKLRGN